MKPVVVLKNAVLLLFATCIFLFLITLSACKDDPEPPPPTQVDIVRDLLTAGTGRWALASVVVEGENAAELFKDFSITFTPTGYTTAGTTPVWARTGTWTFTDETATKFRREDGKEVTIESISATELKLTLFQDEPVVEIEGGRSQALRGLHEFTLTK